MRTTVDIPEPLYRQLKAKAVTQGRSIKALILSGVQNELSVQGRKRRRRVRLPLVRSKRPGSVRLENASIYEIIPFP